MISFFFPFRLVFRETKFADFFLWADRPQGVGMGRKPQLWLKDGDVVEVSMEGVGTCINEVEFVKSRAKL